MTDWLTDYETKRDALIEAGAYDPEHEKSSCGVGLVASIKGTPRRDVVAMSIQALKNVWHRGAVDADGKTGDGAGIRLDIPQAFFKEQVERTGHKSGNAKIAVGMIFLPRTDFGAQETCRTIVETEVLRMGHTIYGWRHVPVNVSCLGEKANATRPEIEQIIISNAKGVDEETFERELYVIRRRIEKAALAAGVLLAGTWGYTQFAGGSGDALAECRIGNVAGGAGSIGGPFELVDETGKTLQWSAPTHWEWPVILVKHGHVDRDGSERELERIKDAMLPV